MSASEALDGVTLASHCPHCVSGVGCYMWRIGVSCGACQHRSEAEAAARRAAEAERIGGDAE